MRRRRRCPVGEDIDDDRLRLILVACHPRPHQAGPSRADPASRGWAYRAGDRGAYLVPEATIAQRIVRAKRAIAREDIRFEVPVGEERSSRLRAVLEVIYLVFNEGYSATTGEEWRRPELCHEALRLGPRAGGAGWGGEPR